MNGPSAPMLGEEPLLVELTGLGIEVGSLAELRRSGARYPAAVPILVDWLKQDTEPKVKGEIARALSVPWAKPAATQALIDAFSRVGVETDPTGTGLRWTIGSALEVVFDDSHFNSFVKLASEKRYGKARQMVVLGLAKSKKPEVVDVLLGLLDDPDVDGHAVKSLAKLGAVAARPVFESKLSDKRAWVRNDARKGLKNLSS